MTIRVYDYRFEPSLIQVRAGTRIGVRVVNESRSLHTWTLRGPRGRVWVDFRLAGGEAGRTVLELEKPGVYEFYCDRTFHPLLGMRGELRVVARP